MRTTLIVLALAMTVSAGQDRKSLYERLGGLRVIAPLVEDMVEVSLTNEIIMGNPKVREAFTREPKSVQKFLVTLKICEVTGGPFKYTGRSIAEAHKNLGITEKEWNELGAQFKKILDKHKVPEQEQKDLLAIIDGYKKDVVTGK